MTLFFDFLRPTPVKLIFLVEWLLLVLFELADGELDPGRALAGSLLPLLFFYLVACTLSARSLRAQHLARRPRLHVLAPVLTLADQALKSLIALSIPYQASLPVVPGLLHLAHERNLRGSWLVETLDLSLVSHAVLVIFILLALPGTLVGYGYYTAHHRRSVWADAAYLGLFSALLSALCDFVLRGYTLDFIQVPGIVTADLKDALITIALAAFFAEAYENPEISLLRWRGWRQESQAWRQLVADMWGYTRQEIARMLAALLKWGRRRFHA